MKKTYEAPLAEVTRFQVEDILKDSVVLNKGYGDTHEVDVKVNLF